MTDTQIF